MRAQKEIRLTLTRAWELRTANVLEMAESVGPEIMRLTVPSNCRLLLHVTNIIKKIGRSGGYVSPTDVKKKA